jgi:hypothetical protein
MINNKFLSGIVLVFPLCAGAATANELLGKWVHVKYQSMRAEISDNGSSFVVTSFKEENFKKFVAKLNDGILIANVGACSVNIDIDKKTGSLLFDGQEYRRLKNGESFEYVKKGLPKGW